MGTLRGKQISTKLDAMPSTFVPSSLHLLDLFTSVLALPAGRLPPWEGKDGHQHHQEPATSRKRSPFLPASVPILKRDSDLALRGSFAEQQARPITEFREMVCTLRPAPLTPVSVPVVERMGPQGI